MTRASAPIPSSIPGALSLGRNISWTTAGNIIYAACQWGVLAVIAKLGTPAMVGMFALGLAITTPIIQFANLQLRGVQATDARGEHPFSDYLTLRMITTLLALMVMVGVARYGGRTSETMAVVMLIALAKAVDATSDIFYGHFQQRERMDRVARAHASNGVLSLVLVAAAMVWSGEIVAGTAGFALASLLPLVAYTIPVTLADGGVRPILRWEPTALARLAATALPLGFVMLLIALNANIPIYLIEHHDGKAAVGVFAALASLVVAGSTVVNAIGQAVSPRLARLHAEGNPEGFRRLLVRLVSVGFGLGAAGAVLAVLAGERIVTALYTREYAADVSVLTWLAIAAGFTYAAAFAGYGMTAARYFAAQLPVFMVVTATSAVTASVLIPRHGLTGAAWTVLVTGCVQLAIVSAVVRIRMRQPVAGRAAR